MVEYPRIPIICGPTASGKTSAALTLAERYRIEIVSADSRQMIRRLDIGTAKPSVEEQERVRFHLIDVVDPGERYTAFRFIDDATVAIRECLSREHLPVVVGGTGLYLRALTEGVVEIEEHDMQIREQLERECQSGHAEQLYRTLTEVDPLEAAKVHPNNHIRLVRALEIYYVTGVPKSELVASGAYRKSDFEFDYFCLAPPREELYNRIHKRVDYMLAAGLLDETERLLADGLEEAVRRSNVIGYNELLDYLNDRCTLDEATALIRQNTRRYAKRQMTWFRGQSGVEMSPDSVSLLTSLCAKIAQESSRFEKT